MSQVLPSEIIFPNTVLAGAFRSFHAFYEYGSKQRDIPNKMVHIKAKCYAGNSSYYGF